MDYIAQVQSSNKKDAQSKAAWDFCENLVKTGYMKQSELPPKPVSTIFFGIFNMICHNCRKYQIILGK